LIGKLELTLGGSSWNEVVVEGKMDIEDDAIGESRRVEGYVAFGSWGLGDIRGGTISTLDSCCCLIGGENGS
jgi:hypothetical protein